MVYREGWCLGDDMSVVYSMSILTWHKGNIFHCQIHSILVVVYEQTMILMHY